MKKQKHVQGRKSVLIEVSPALHLALTARARASGISRNRLISEILERSLKPCSR